MAGGRPTKFTEQTRKKIYKHIRDGASYKVAALAAGVGESTLREWRAKAKACAEAKSIDEIDSKFRIRDEGQRLEYAEFSADILRAEAIGEATCAARIAKAGRGGHKLREVREKIREAVTPQGKIVTLHEKTIITREIRPDWRADAWVLERRHPERWGRKRRMAEVEVKAPVDEFEKTLPSLTEEDLKWLESISEKLASPVTSDLGDGVFEVFEGVMMLAGQYRL